MRSEPFLWLHLAGAFLVPLTLEGVWLALAIGKPLPFVWLELLIIAIFGMIPVFWMQWHRPFNLFGLLLVTLRPESLSETQRRILTLLKGNQQKFLSIIVATFLLICLWQIYRFAPLAAIAASHFPQWRLLAILMAALAFFFSNLFLQISLSALGVLLTTEKKYQQTEPYPFERIKSDFSSIGIKVTDILTPISES